ncbi:uncharacterized protein V1516DRAFT_656025 [Lipomyces oligophaga]|uniref:uncharacterized protein n=1 Tax=Lipomyces oligophaga TaxID=45792 RepID=UPI0034CF0649
MSVVTAKRRVIEKSPLTLSQKVFVRSRKGKASKIVQEHYLRDDIPCSSQLCASCSLDPPKDSSGIARPFVLSNEPYSVKPWGPHYLVPDTNIYVKAMDLLENRSAFYDVIVMQTALEELKNISLPLYNRLRALTKSQDKRFYVFHNNFRQETFVERMSGESANDHNDRAIRTACAWYKVHLQEMAKSPPSVLLLTDDRENLRKAKEIGLSSTNLESYLSKIPNGETLFDMIAVENDGPKSKAGSQEQRAYDEHYSSARIEGGIRDGILHQGILNISQYNYLEGTVSVDSFDRPLLVLGRESLNRAIQGDVVVVELLSKSQWKHPSTKIIEEAVVTKNENPDDEEGEQNLVTAEERRALVDLAHQAQRTSAEYAIQPTAKVVGIVNRRTRSYVGHIDPSSIPLQSSGARRQTSVFVLPLNKQIPKIRIFTRQAEILAGNRLLVSIDKWESTSRHPMGHFIRNLGEIESAEAETEAVLLEYEVEYQPFTQSVLDCLPAEGHNWQVPEKSDPRWEGREDLRDLPICSIDPPGCQDIDDALHARPLPNGNYEVGVHIADVSHFVKPDNAMDSEAASRGTTVYLVDKRIDMLPVLLGTDLCSLRPYVERFAFSAIWEMSEDAEIQNVRFTKSVIQSKEAFSYEQAQLRIDDKTQRDPLTEAMRTLLRLSKILRQKRMDAGALNLASPEVKVQVESETSDPGDIEIKKLLDTNSLVEEFMLLANISVATKIYELFPQSAMLRRHGTPPKANFEVLADQLRVVKGMTLKMSTSRELADSLDTCVDKNDPFLNTLVRIMATRCMLAAEYFCSGSIAYTEFAHYGLATPIYTHWTSPIRRYADIVAHRQLAAAISYEPLHESLRDKPRLERICQNINRRHRNAQFAGRASIEYHVGRFLKNKEIETEGYIMKVFSNGFVVFVTQFQIESAIRISELTGPEIPNEFDEEHYQLVLYPDTEREIKLQLFDKVIVRVETELEESTGKRKVVLRLKSPKLTP